jgi:phosphoserine phosphatase
VQPEQILEKLRRKIQAVEDRVHGSGVELKSGPKRAVFDLDNTLLDGDVGDAVFVQLKLDETIEAQTVTQRPIPLSWQEYQDILDRQGKVAAYKKITAALAGIPLDSLRETTRRVMDLPAQYLELEGCRVPVPAPNPTMQALVGWLQSQAYEVYIISASNRFTVEVVGAEHFAIPRAHCFGIESVLQEVNGRPVLTDQLKEPLPITVGKAEIYHRHIGPEPPLITAGDSDTDIHLLNLTHPGGLSIWRGSPQKFHTVRQQMHHPPCLYPLDSPTP